MASSPGAVTDPEFAVEDLLRREAPQVLGALVRRYGHFHLAEEAVQDALLAASRRWPEEGVPSRPRGWLIRVASGALIDALRSESSRVAREERVLLADPGATAGVVAAPEPGEPAADHDDSLDLLFMCAHPVLSQESAVALTLRAVGGLTTDEIAAAFLVPSATMGQRISRAKKTVQATGVSLALPAPGELEPRLRSVLAVLSLMFNEGYVASSGQSFARADLEAEAVRLTRLLAAALRHAEIGGLLALELFTQARRSQRVRDGVPVPLAEQDRTAWDAGLIAEGVATLDAAMARGPLGRFQLQAAIGALHVTAPTAEATDWVQILGLYELLARYDESPLVPVNAAVARAHVAGPRAGLAALDAAAADPRLARSHRVAVVRAHLLEDAGDPGGARAAYRDAARQTRSVPERTYLLRRAEALDPGAR